MNQHSLLGSTISALLLTGCASDPPPPPPEPSPYANATVREGYHVASNDTVAVPAQRTFLVVDGTSAHGIAAPEKELPVQDLTEANLPPAQEEEPRKDEPDAEEEAGKDHPSDDGASSASDGDGASSSRDAEEDREETAEGVPEEITARQLRAWETYCDHPKGMTAEDWDIISRFDGIPDWVKDPGPGIEEPLRSKLRGCSDKAWR